MIKEKKEKDKTAAEGVLDAFLPGLGKAISNLKNASPSFKQRIEEADNEIERRIAAGGLSSRGLRSQSLGGLSSIPSREPIFDCNIRVRTLVPENDTAFEPLMKKKANAPISPKPKQRGADVFDEGDKIIVVVELPGIKKEDINVKINGDIAEISAGNHNEKIRLPSKVHEKPAIKFKNGILELRLAKKAK